MQKQFLPLEKQIESLRTKQVTFDDASTAQQVLLDSNYYNLVSCSKAKFATGRDQTGKYIYTASTFTQWQTYFVTDCQLSEHLMKNILRFERTINSRTAYYVSELIAQKTLSTHQTQGLIDLIRGRDQTEKYNGAQTWKTITKKTFGELRAVIKWLWNNDQRMIVQKIFKGVDFLKSHTLQRLDELVNLRNTIFHFTPLTIYLVYGATNSRSVYSVRKTVIESMFYWESNELAKKQMTEVFRVTKKFNKAKRV